MKVPFPNVFLQRPKKKNNKQQQQQKKTEKNISTTVSKREYISMSVILWLIAFSRA